LSTKIIVGFVPCSTWIFLSILCNTYDFLCSFCKCHVLNFGWRKCYCSLFFAPLSTYHLHSPPQDLLDLLLSCQRRWKMSTKSARAQGGACGQLIIRASTLEFCSKFFTCAHDEMVHPNLSSWYLTVVLATKMSASCIVVGTLWLAPWGFLPHVLTSHLISSLRRRE